MHCIVWYSIPAEVGHPGTSVLNINVYYILQSTKTIVLWVEVTCGSSSDGSVGVAAWHWPSISDSASSSSTSWIVGVTSDGGMDVFFFFLFFFRRRSILRTLLRKRCGGRWVDRGWCVWWKVCRWSVHKEKERERLSKGWCSDCTQLTDAKDRDCGVIRETSKGQWFSLLALYKHIWTMNATIDQTINQNQENFQRNIPENHVISNYKVF